MPQRDFSVEESPAGWTQLLRTHPQQLGAGTVIFGLHMWAALESLELALRIDAWVLCAIAATYITRWLIHIHLGYFDMTTAAARWLAFVTLLDLGAGGGLADLAFHAVEAPTINHVIVCVPVLVLMVPLLSSATVCLLDRPELGFKCRGSEWVQGLHVLKFLDWFLRPLAGAPVLSGLPFLVRWITPTSQVSSYTVALMTVALAMFSSVATGNAVDHRTLGKGESAWVRSEESFMVQILEPRNSLKRNDGQLLPRASLPRSQEDTYPADCPGYPTPGTSTQGQSVLPHMDVAPLRALYEGDAHVAGLGARVAGCTWSAHREKSQPSRSWVSGWCGPQLRSIAVAWPGGSAIMLQQIAVFARYLAMRGLLLSATARFDAGAGDFQVVRSRYGDVLFIRMATSGGTATSSSPEGACAPLTSRNVAYVELPPAMTVLWLRLMEQYGEWIWPVYDYTTRGRAFDFLANGPDGANLARGTCDRNGSCSLSNGRGTQTLKFRFGLYVNLVSILHFAPPRSG